MHATRASSRLLAPTHVYQIVDLPNPLFLRQAAFLVRVDAEFAIVVTVHFSRKTSVSRTCKICCQCASCVYSETFAPYQERCTDALHTLLQNVQSGDAKMRVLFVFSFVIERLGSQVTASISKLAEILPTLWMESESHNMLRYCLALA